MVNVLIRKKIIPETLIDVGANVGQFSVASNELYKNITTYAFEALPECAVDLKNNIKRYEDITIYKKAVGNYVGEVEFHVNQHKHSSSIFKLGDKHLDAFPKFRERGLVTVPITTLDVAFENVSLCAPILLKIDVQGYEMNVIKGAIKTLAKIDFVVIEVSFVPLYEGESTFSDILLIMSELGFKFKMPVGWLVHPKNKELLQIDALFINDRLSAN